MRHLRIWIDGGKRSGKVSWLVSLTNDRRFSRLGRDYIAWLKRAMEGHPVTLASGETIVLHAGAAYFGSAYVARYADALGIGIEWIAEIAELVHGYLPTVDALVHVTSPLYSDPLVPGRDFHRVRTELAHAGHDPDRLPTLFSFNMRDRADAAPLARLRHAYWTPRCVQRESIACVGIGVSAGLDALVGLIDGTHSPVSRAAEPPRSSALYTLDPCSALLDSARIALLEDGGAFAVRALRTTPAVVDVEGAVVVSYWLAPESEIEIACLPGTYRVEVADRTIDPVDRSWFVPPERIAVRLARIDSAPGRRERLFGFDARDGQRLHRSSVMLFGPRESVRAAARERLHGSVYAAYDENGAAVVAPRDRQFVPAERGTLAFLSPGLVNEAHGWVGFDRDDRVVELIVYGDVGRAVLANAELRNGPQDHFRDKAITDPSLAQVADESLDR